MKALVGRSVTKLRGLGTSWKQTWDKGMGTGLTGGGQGCRAWAGWGQAGQRVHEASADPDPALREGPCSGPSGLDHPTVPEPSFCFSTRLAPGLCSCVVLHKSFPPGFADETGKRVHLAPRCGVGCGELRFPERWSPQPGSCCLPHSSYVLQGCTSRPSRTWHGGSGGGRCSASPQALRDLSRRSPARS